MNLGRYNLGASYYQGQGVSKSHKEAVKWYRKAADQGLCHAQFNLGGMSEIGTFPQIHQPEHPLMDPPQAGFPVAFEQVHFLKPLEYPEWEVDLDAVRIEDLPVEIVRQSFAYHGWLISELQPARVGFEEGILLRKNQSHPHDSRYMLAV